MTHINPGTDTTINPIVIDDSYRERKKQANQRRFWMSETQLMALRQGHTHVSAFDKKNIMMTVWDDQMIHTSALSQPTEAQQRIDAAIKELYKARGAGTFEEIDNHIDEAIALLQAGRK